MPDIAFVKTVAGFFPVDHQSKQICEGFKSGDIVRGSFRKVRNPQFHRKFFALLNLAFEYWEPGEINSKYGKPEKNFDRFREDLIILAGHFNIVIRLDGTAKPEAKSISFANMEQAEFEQLYNSVLNVILKKINVLQNMTAEAIDGIVNEMLSFG